MHPCAGRKLRLCHSNLLRSGKLRLCQGLIYLQGCKGCVVFAGTPFSFRGGWLDCKCTLLSHPPMEERERSCPTKQLIRWREGRSVRSYLCLGVDRHTSKRGAMAWALNSGRRNSTSMDTFMQMRPLSRWRGNRCPGGARHPSQASNRAPTATLLEQLSF